jgi:hypothetical protein
LNAADDLLASLVGFTNTTATTGTAGTNCI